MFRFVRETLGPNRGVWVEAFQRIGDGQPGDSWCAHALSAWLWIAYQGPAPLPRTGSCATMLQAADAHGWRVVIPTKNDVFFRVDASGHAHHCGLATSESLGRIGTIAGNTSEDGLSADGTGVFEHAVPFASSLVFVRLPLQRS